MKAAGANLIAHIDQESTTTCFLFRIARTDGPVRLFTDHDEPIPIDVGFGAETYLPAGGPVRSAIRTSANYALDDLEAVGPTIALDSAALDPDDLRDGIYDGAEFAIYEVNWQAPADGAILWRRGWLGPVTYSDGRYTAALDGMMRRLDRKVMRKVSRYCDVERLGDARCGVILDPTAWAALTAYQVGDVVKAAVYDGRRYVCTVAGTTGAAEPAFDTTVGNLTVDATVTWRADQAFTQLAEVATVTDKQTFTIAPLGGNPAVDAVDDFFNFGRAVWTTGANTGREKEIKDWTLAGAAVVLFEGMNKDIAIGDRMTLITGCDRLKPTCITKFDIVENFRGFSFTPTAGDVTETPDAR